MRHRLGLHRPHPLLYDSFFLHDFLSLAPSWEPGVGLAGSYGRKRNPPIGGWMPEEMAQPEDEVARRHGYCSGSNKWKKPRLERIIQGRMSHRLCLRFLQNVKLSKVISVREHYWSWFSSSRIKLVIYQFKHWFEFFSYLFYFVAVKAMKMENSENGFFFSSFSINHNFSWWNFLHFKCCIGILHVL